MGPRHRSAMNSDGGPPLSSAESATSNSRNIRGAGIREEGAHIGCFPAGCAREGLRADLQLSQAPGDSPGRARGRGLSLCTTRNIQQNLFFPVSCNALGVPAAAGIRYSFFRSTEAPFVRRFVRHIQDAERPIRSRPGPCLRDSGSWIESGGDGTERGDGKNCWQKGGLGNFPPGRGRAQGAWGMPGTSPSTTRSAGGRVRGTGQGA